MSCTPWPVAWACDSEPASTPEQYDAAFSAAQSMLNHLTGSRFGLCTSTERYQAVPSRAGTCVPGVSGGNCCAILLAHRPVQRIIAVNVNGVPAAPGSYRLLGSGYLASPSCWPSSGDCEPGAVVVTYEHGISLHGPEYGDPVEDGGEPVLTRAASPYWGAAALAMGELIEEFIAGMCGGQCKLPSRVAAITRQGVTVTMVTPEQWFALGLTGLPLTDAFVRQVNPNGRRMSSQVYSPDMARRR